MGRGFSEYLNKDRLGNRTTDKFSVWPDLKAEKPSTLLSGLLILNGPLPLTTITLLLKILCDPNVFYRQYLTLYPWYIGLLRKRCLLDLREHLGSQYVDNSKNNRILLIKRNMDKTFIARERGFSVESYGVKFVDYLCISGEFYWILHFGLRSQQTGKLKITIF